MAIKKKKICVTLIAVACILSVLFWVSLRKVEIIAVHKNDNHNYVLVKKFPFTDKGKIKWWLDNKKVLKEVYKIPSTKPDGSFVIVFWDFGEGYKETDGYDRLCFNDMKPPINCIDKDSLLMVRNSKNTGLYFLLSSGSYRINSEGKIIKIKSD